jgi:hypothetical protein
MIQVVTAVRRVFVQCLFPKCVIGYLQYKLFFTLGGVRNVGSSIRYPVIQRHQEATLYHRNLSCNLVQQSLEKVMLCVYGVVSPILANIYLHTVLDEWFEETVRTHCIGHVYLCRYADDFAFAFQTCSEPVELMTKMHNAFTRR